MPLRLQKPSWLKMPLWSKIESSSKALFFSTLGLGIPRNYRSDWQYVIAASRMSSALSLATLFSVIAIVTKFTDLVNLGRAALYFFMSAVITYGLALLVIRSRAPAFLQEYPDYKTFDDKKHSHRWILWEFHNNVRALNAGFKLLKETVEKNLSIDVTKPPARSRLPIMASFTTDCTKKAIRNEAQPGIVTVNEFRVYKPYNFDRDLIMGFTIKSSVDNIERKYVLPIREADDKRDLKCKELFWITFTEAAGENPRSKLAAWILIRLSILLLITALVLAVIHSLWGTPPSARSPAAYFHYA